MRIDIRNKIEEIRQKPEHIRLRYVWAMMAISMLCIVFIWFFSFLAEEKSSESSVMTPNDQNIENIKQSQQEIQNAASGMKQTLDTAKNQIQSQGAAQ